MNKGFHRSNMWSMGSTLIEVIISIAVVVLVLVTIVAGGTLVTRNRRFSGKQVAATKYSQEVVEWAKNMRNSMGWQTFNETVFAKGTPVATVCLVTLPVAAAAFDALAPGACMVTDVISGTEFRRSVQFGAVSATEVRVVGYVDWTDNDLDHQTKAEAVLKEWQ